MNYFQPEKQHLCLMDSVPWDNARPRPLSALIYPCDTNTFRKVHNDKMREQMENNKKIQLNEGSKIELVRIQTELESMRGLESAQVEVNNSFHKQLEKSDAFKLKTDQRTESSKVNPEISTERHTSSKVAKYQSRANDFFKNLYGEEFHISDELFRIETPVIPSFLVVSSCLADGISPVILGRGSYGRVLKANFHSCLSYGKEIVVKEIFDHRRNVEAIFREAQTLLYLERTGYVPVCFGVVSDGDVEDAYGILQECIGRGMTLDSYLWKVRGKIPSIHLIDIARQMAEGLKKIHEMGVLINDIKANNVLVNEVHGSPEVRYCDMGLATYKCGRIYRYSSEADEFGYLAPEVRYGGISSFKSDVYSLGYLFELIQDFGEFNHLYPAIDICLVENPRQRCDAVEALEIVSSIYNQQCFREWKRMERQAKGRPDLFENQSPQGTDMPNRTSMCESAKRIGASKSDLFEHISSFLTSEISEPSGLFSKGCQRDQEHVTLSSSLISRPSCTQRLTDYDADCESSDDEEFLNTKAKVPEVRPTKLKKVPSVTDIVDQFRNGKSSDGVQYNSIPDFILEAYVVLLSQNKDHRIFTFWAIIFTLFFTTLFKIFLILYV